MKETHNICCPNCGSSSAQRRCLIRTDAKKCQGRLVKQVECPACDYLMVTCAVDGRVLEAYSSGLPAPHFTTQRQSARLALHSQTASNLAGMMSSSSEADIA